MVSDLKDHPLRKMLELGLSPTVNSDDPSYFGGYLNENYIQISDALNLTFDEIIVLIKNGFEGAYIDAERETALLVEVTSCLKSHGFNYSQ